MSSPFMASSQKPLDAPRNGAGPTLIEAVTYRLGDHTTADDASRYRDDAEVSQHWPEEPILRMRRYMTNMGYWTAADEDRLLHQVAAEMDGAAETYLSMPAQDPASMFDFTYTNFRPILRRNVMRRSRSHRPKLGCRKSLSSRPSISRSGVRC
jgi:2-oxoisovalerate dehydrogenase E1 component alpha subunit